MNYYKAINRSMKIKISDEVKNLTYLSDKIDSNNPLATLKKGYSLVFKDDEPLKAEEKLKKNDKIIVRTHTQELSCTVDSTKTVRKKETV